MSQDYRRQVKFNAYRTSAQLRQAQFEAGWLGRCFGSRRHAPLNIAGLAILQLLAIGCLISLFGTDVAVQEYWAIAKPLIGVSVGFVFGHQFKAD